MIKLLSRFSVSLNFFTQYISTVLDGVFRLVAWPKCDLSADLVFWMRLGSRKSKKLELFSAFVQGMIIVDTMMSVHDSEFATSHLD